VLRSSCPIMDFGRLIKATVFIFVTGDIALQYYGPYASFTTVIMSLPKALVLPRITDEQDTDIHHQLPLFSETVSAIQRGILLSPKLLLYFVGLALGSLSVEYSAENEALFKQIWLFIRDYFPTILLKNMPHGSYGSVGLLRPGKPFISLSHDLVWAFENATSDNRLQLRVVVTTAFLRELSHSIHPFIFGCLQPEIESPGNRFFEDRVLRCFLGLSFDQDATDISSLKGIFLTSGDKCHIPGQSADPFNSYPLLNHSFYHLISGRAACSIWFNALVAGRDPAWDLNTIPVEGAPEPEVTCTWSYHVGKNDAITSVTESPLPPPPPPTPARPFPDSCCLPGWEALPTPSDFSPVPSPSPSPPPTPPPTISINIFSVAEEQLGILFAAWTNGNTSSGSDILTKQSTGGKVFDENYVQQMYERINSGLIQQLHDKIISEPILPPILSQSSLPGSLIMDDSASSRRGHWCYRDVVRLLLILFTVFQADPSS
jgi:hypothetical protein